MTLTYHWVSPYRICKMKQQTHAFARSKSFEPIRISFKFYKVKVDSSSRQIHFYTHHIPYMYITHPYTLILLIIILQPRCTSHMSYHNI